MSLASILKESVTQAEDDTWNFQCVGLTDSPCGEPGGQPFHSDGWPTKKAATARGEQHYAEHRGDGVMQDLDDFRAEHGLVVVPGGVKVEDL